MKMKKTILLATMFAVITIAIVCMVFALCGIGFSNGNEADASIPSDLAELSDIDKPFLTILHEIYGEDVNFVFYDTRDITADLLTNRTSEEVIVERTYGTVLNCDGDGMILNIDSDFNYISYSKVGFDIRVGDTILTYFLYNPETSYTDDIIARFDYPLEDKIIDAASCET